MKIQFILPLIFQLLVTLSHAKCIQIKVDRVFDGQNTHTEGLITIENGIVKSVTEVDRNPKCLFRQYKGATALPGLIDTHSLIFALDDTFGIDFGNALIRNQKMSEDNRFKMASQRLCQYLQAGFTSLRDLGNSNRFFDVEQRNLINRYQLELPTLYVSGPGITAKGGQFSNKHLENDEYSDYLGKESVNSLIDERVKMGVDWLKLYSDNDPNPNWLSAENLKAIVKKAKAANLPVAIHATNQRSISRAIAAKATSIQHGYGATFEQLTEMKNKKIFLVPTDRGELIVNLISRHLTGDDLFNFSEINKRDLASSIKRLADATRAGVTIAFGSDFYLATGKLNIDFIRGVYSSLYSLKQGGLSPTQILRTATSNAANLLGRKDIGNLTHGALANILIVRGNPTEEIRSIENVLEVYKKGKSVYKKGMNRCPNIF